MEIEAVSAKLEALIESGRYSADELFSIHPIVVLTLALEAGQETWTDEDYEDVASALWQIGVQDDLPAERVNFALSRYLESEDINADLVRDVFQILVEAFGDDEAAMDLRAHAKNIGVDTRQAAPTAEETHKPKSASLGSLAQLKFGAFRI